MVTILVFGVYLLAECRGPWQCKNSRKRPETSVMIGSGEKFETSFFCKTKPAFRGRTFFLSTESASVTGSFHVTLYQEEKEIQDWETNRLTISAGDTTYFQLDQRILNCKGRKFRIILDEATGDTGVAAGVINKKRRHADTCLPCYFQTIFKGTCAHGYFSGVSDYAAGVCVSQKEKSKDRSIICSNLSFYEFYYSGSSSCF